MDHSPLISSNLSQHDSTAGGMSSSSHSSMGSLERAADIPIKYTPVTGRISRAKKGVPVHTCEICRPVKTFTRAEHLRRHQLSHQKPAYTCTFEDCERAFHRADLLARHLHRHETQGEKAYKNRNPGSRDSSPERSMGESSMTLSSFSKVTSSFQAVNFSPGALGSYRRSASQAQLPGAGTLILAGNFEQMSFAAAENATKQADSSWLSRPFEDEFQSYNLTPQLPLLRIPEETYVPGLSYSYDSVSTYSSTQSDGSGVGPVKVSTLLPESRMNLPSWPQSSHRCSPSMEPSLNREDDHGIEISLPRANIPFDLAADDLNQNLAKNNGTYDASLISKTSPAVNGGKEMMKIQNLLSEESSQSSTFTCLVTSCPIPGSNFLTRVAQTRHYELFHPSILLQCEFEDCNESGAAFIIESERVEHYSSHHRCNSNKQPQISDSQKKGDQQEDERGSHSKISSASRQKRDVSPEYGMVKGVSPPIKSEDSSGDSERLETHEILAGIPLFDTESKSPGRCSPKSTRSTWRESSDNFETDSVSSEEETDWEEDDLSFNSNIIAIACKQMHANSRSRSEHGLNPIINPVKESLIERIMEDFWIIFNQEWSANIRRRTASPSTPSSSVSGPSSKWTAEKTNKKHKRSTDYNQDHLSDDDDENEGPKRPRRSAALTEDGEESQQKFSCPYRKHNPRKYTHSDRRWRSCALTPFSTIARVKGHLYRHHRIFQCRRCSELFKDEDALQTHFMAIDPCGLQDSVTAEGITPVLEKQLRSRKKTCKNQTEDERWQDIYRILFPMEIVPSSAFEPVQDEAIQSPASFELSNYEEFSRHELPRVFRTALEAAINTAAQPLEEQVRSQLVSMIQECQDRVFSSYRNLSSSGPGLSRIAQGPLNASAPIITSSLPGGLGNPNDLPEERSENFLDNLYQRPPYQSQTLSNSVFHLHNQRQAFETRRQNEPSESGYVSDFSGLNAPRSLSTDTSTDLTTASSRSGANSQSQPTSNYVGEYSSGTQPSMSYNENDTPGTLSLDGEVVALPLSEDFSEMYMYGDHSWEVPFPQ